MIKKEQKMIKKGKKKRIIKDWKNPLYTNVQYHIWTNDSSRPIYDSSSLFFLLYFLECGKKIKEVKNLYNCIYKFRIRQSTIVKYRIINSEYMY